MVKVHRQLVQGMALLLSLLVAWPMMSLAAEDAELLSYTRQHDLLTNTDDIPLLRVYESGRVRVHYPATMKKAGDYEYFLSEGEMEKLRARVNRQSLTGFDGASIRKKVELTQASRLATGGKLVTVSDNTYTLLTLGGAQKKVIRWANLQHDARLFGNVAELAELAETERLLQKLADHPRMKKLD